MKVILFFIICFIIYIIAIKIFADLTLRINVKKPNLFELLISIITPFIIMLVGFITTYNYLFV